MAHPGEYRRAAQPFDFPGTQATALARRHLTG
jgi:hypothetical protein